MNIYDFKNTQEKKRVQYKGIISTVVISGICVVTGFWSLLILQPVLLYFLMRYETECRLKELAKVKRNKLVIDYSTLVRNYKWAFKLKGTNQWYGSVKKPSNKMIRTDSIVPLGSDVVKPVYPESIYQDQILLNVRRLK